MTTSETPAAGDLLDRAAAIVPLLRREAARGAADGSLTPAAVTALDDAGMFRLRMPRRFGGSECEAATLSEIAATLATGDGAAAWVTSVYAIPTWMTAQFPDAVVEEVFGSANPLVCGTLSPSAIARPVDGGVVVDGKWGFISGALHAGWQEIIAILASPEGEPYPIAALVPLDDLLVVQDWDAAGLAGSGSVSTVASELFVPAERILPLPVVLEGSGTSQIARESAIYGGPLLPTAAASSVGTAVGLARAAREIFLQRMPERKITYTGYTSQRDAPVTHLQLAGATERLDQAEFHARRLTTTVDRKNAAGEPWKLDERARARGDLGSTVAAARDCVDGLAAASGGSSVYRGVPMGRIHADVRAIALHALMNPTTNAELYGRVLAGLEPDTPYI